MWLLYALGSAFFAGITAILAKIGIKNTDSNLATAIRTIVILFFSWLMVFIVGSFNTITDISSKTLVFLILFLVIQQIEGNVIYPHIVGKSVGLPAIWTLMAVYAGGQLLGIIGMFLFVPIVSVIYTLLKEDVNKKTQKNNRANN